MLKRILEKYLCLHKWKSHALKEYIWSEEEQSLNPEVILTRNCQKTTEILICEHCGAIKKLEY